MIRVVVALMVAAAPAVAREVRGRVSRVEGPSDGKLRAVVATADGDVTIAVAGTPPALRENARIKAIIDDACDPRAGLCLARSVEEDRSGGIKTVEAMKERAADADAALDHPAAAAVGAASSGTAGDARDAAGDLAGNKPKRPFIKGELTNLGSDKLVVADSRFGLRLGYAHLDSSSYMLVAPEVDLHLGDQFALGLGVPLHVRAYADGFYDTGKIKLREHDYDNPSDYARILRFLTYGKKEDPIYLNVSQLFAASIGHGTIVRRYSGNTDNNITRVGAEFDAYAKYGGFEAYTGDIVQPQHFLAGLAFIKPLGWAGGDTWSNTSLGISAAMDLAAPYTLDRAPSHYINVGDSDVCPQPGVADCHPGEPMARETRRAQVVGADVETKIVKTETSDVKPYLDYSRLLNVADPDPGLSGKGGGGLTLGMLGRFNTGEVKVHAFRLVGEVRYFDGNYLPGYFDTFYEVQKYQFITGKADPAYEPKLRTITSRDPAHKRGGFYAEAAYQYNGGLAVMAAFEDSFHVSGPDSICFGCTGPAQYVGSRNLTLHIEYPAYSWLQFFASFYRRSFDGAPVDTSRPLGDNTLVYGAARLHVLSVMFLNARVFRSWQADPVLGEMKNLWGGDFDLEFGWEFDRSKQAGRP